MKLLVEQCSTINISTLQKTIRKIINRDLVDPNEDEIFQHTEAELHKFTINEQTFQYTYLKNHMGGYRWYFKCEKCGNRAFKLFLPPEGFNKERKYLCKECHELLNECVVKANHGTYKKVIKPLKRLRKIEAKLEKGHLSAKKIEELLNEYDAIDQEMKNAPEYRLYTFKKKRGMNLS